ncbi:L,D-transpeptidase family protein [Terrabacter sp. 2RAF25]|uniref:L,D-transpeptidase family protein n=1 Tax=Terrabacter sp. 2RAF25 TaxID=3232998 RepID=UPI003F9DDEF1
MRTIRMDYKRTTTTIAATLAVVALTVGAPAARADDATGTPAPTGTSSTTATTAPTAPPTTQSGTKAGTQAPAQAATSSPPPARAAAAAAAPTAVIPRTAPVSRVKDLQVRLKLVGQFPYAITGVYWSAVDRAVLAFQHARGLTETGVVDQPTWDRLRALTNSPVVLPRTATALRVKDLQARLKANGRFAYGITGVYWSAVDRSVLTFQILYDLPQTGVVDQRTWDRLKAVTASPVAIGRTASTAQLKEVQLRLRALGSWSYGITGVYWSALDGAVLTFQQKRGLPQSGVIDQRTWSRLVALTYAPGTFDQHRFNAGLRPVMPTVGSLDGRCRTGRVMCVDKATRTLTWVVDGKPLMVMWARFGRPGKETREGTFRVSRMYEYVISNLYFTPMPYSMFFSGGQAVHYSSNFARLGYASASHGCVNIADHAQIKTLFFLVRVGDKVVVHH